MEFVRFRTENEHIVILASHHLILIVVEATTGDSDKEDLNSRDSEEDDLAETEEKTWSREGDEVIEPCVGMEFDSEDDARRFYNDYARRVGFVVRVMQRRRSEIDGRTLARRLGCNKQGFSPSTKGVVGPEKKPRPSAREGCKATILFKMEKSGKWVVTRFVKEHNHPLVVMAQEYTNVVRLCHPRLYYTIYYTVICLLFNSPLHHCFGKGINVGSLIRLRESKNLAYIL